MLEKVSDILEHGCDVFYDAPFTIKDVVKIDCFMTPISTDLLFKGMVKIGVRYTTKNGIMILFGLKTHLGVAYHFDYGIGYRLNFCMKKKITT